MGKWDNLGKMQVYPLGNVKKILKNNELETHQAFFMGKLTSFRLAHFQ